MLAACALSPPAMAQDLEMIGLNDKYTVYGVPDSIVREGDKVTVWTRWIPNLNADLTPMDVSASSLYVIECKARRAGLRATLEYSDVNMTGYLGKTQVEPGQEKFGDISPGTMLDSVRRWVCKEKKPIKPKANK